MIIIIIMHVRSFSGFFSSPARITFSESETPSQFFFLFFFFSSHYRYVFVDLALPVSDSFPIETIFNNNFDETSQSPTPLHVALLQSENVSREPRKNPHDRSWLSLYVTTTPSSSRYGRDDVIVCINVLRSDSDDNIQVYFANIFDGIERKRKKTDHYPSAVK